MRVTKRQYIIRFFVNGYTAGSTPTGQEWETVMEEDDGHDYSLPNSSGNATTPSIGSEVGINTSSSMGSSCENEEVQELMKKTFNCIIIIDNYKFT